MRLNGRGWWVVVCNVDSVVEDARKNLSRVWTYLIRRKEEAVGARVTELDETRVLDTKISVPVA